MGKTTTAVNLTASFAVGGKQTLLMDLDPSGSAGYSLNFRNDTRSSGNYEIFSFAQNIPQCTHSTAIQRMDFVPMNMLTPVEEERLIRLSENKMLLHQLLINVKNKYDYIILDCPPALGGLTTAALVAADSVLIPVKSDQMSMESIAKLYDYLKQLKRITNRELRTEGILRTMYEKRSKRASVIDNYLIERYNNSMLKTVIPKNNALSEASYHGKPVLLFKPDSPGAISYMALADEIMSNVKSNLFLS